MKRYDHKNIIEFLLDPSHGLFVFMSILGIAYGLLPICVSMFLPNNEVFLKLAGITAVSLLSMWVGSRIPMFDQRFKSSARRLRWSPMYFNIFTWGIFIIFLVITFATAQSIPIWSALMGADSNELSLQRGAFLKGREGVGFVLQYLSAIFVNTLVPYSIILLYETKNNKRHVAAVLFLGFCISFMQKALFLNLIFPMLAFFAIKRRLHGKIFFRLIIGSTALLIATTFLSLQSEDIVDNHGGGNYLSASYIPVNSLDYFFWRAIAVPVFTATDTLVVHEQFGSHPLMGATSSFISSLFRLERMNIERYVFEYQFGGWNDIANANAVFMIDAFVNFDWIGVFIFGLFVGQIFRWFHISKDVAFRSLWPLFAFALYSAPLIGLLLSNGFLYLIFHALFVRLDKNVRKLELNSQVV